MTDRPDPLDPILERMLRRILPAATVPLLLFGLAFAAWLWAYNAENAALVQTLNYTLAAAGVLVFLGVAFGAATLVWCLYLGLNAVDDRSEDPASPDGTRRLIKHAGFHATLLVINLPAVFLLATVVMGLVDRTYVTVDNRSTKTLSDLTVVDDSGEHPVGGVPGATLRTLRLQTPSDFTLRGVLGEEEVELGAFALGPGGTAKGRVTIGEDGAVNVETAHE